MNCPHCRCGDDLQIIEVIGEGKARHTCRKCSYVWESTDNEDGTYRAEIPSEDVHPNIIRKLEAEQARKDRSLLETFELVWTDQDIKQAGMACPRCLKAHQTYTTKENGERKVKCIACEYEWTAIPAAHLHGWWAMIPIMECHPDIIHSREERI